MYLGVYICTLILGQHYISFLQNAAGPTMRYMIYAEMHTLRVLTSHFVFMVTFFLRRQ